MGIQRAIRYPIVIIALAAAVLPRQANAEEEKSTNWGNATGLRSPHADSKGRSGYWWWPEHSESSTQQKNIRGNRGRVFAAWMPNTNATAIETPPPPPGPPFIHTHSRIILNNLLFRSDSIEIRPEGKEETDKLIAEMRKSKLHTVTCIGHTDDVGSQAFNQQLGLRRAQAVVDYMIAAGIEPERVRAESMGETQPAVPNDSPANRALNRRVVFKITPEY